MNSKRVITERPLFGHSLTMSTLFAMFSNLYCIDSFARDYSVDSDASQLVDTLCLGLGRDVNVRYENVEKKLCANRLNNNVVVCFSGGKDSVAAAIKLRDEGRNVFLFHVAGINTSYPDEIMHVVQLAQYLNMPLHVMHIKQQGKTSFKESPVKNQLIASLALDYAVENNIGVSICFGDFKTDTTQNSQFFESWSDTQEMWSAWLALVRSYFSDIELIIPFDTYNETLDIISDSRELLEKVCGCIMPYRFRKMTRERNEKKYIIELLPNRCGSCWKCCTEYIFLVDKGIVPLNNKFYEHCLNFLVKKLPSVHPEVKELTVKSAYETFLHRPFNNSVFYF